MLDVPSITFLSNYLQGYPSTVLVVSHDRAFLNEVATDIVHQHSERLDYYKGANFGKSIRFNLLLELANTMENLSTQPRKSAGRTRSASTKSSCQNDSTCKVRATIVKILLWLILTSLFLAFIDKFRYNAAKSSEAQSRIKKLERMPVLEEPEGEYTVHFQFPEVEKLSPPIVQMSEVAFGYTPENQLLKDVELDVQLDSRIGIVGPNGAGKTTVLKLLTGQLQPSKGFMSQHSRLRVGFFAQHHVDALDMSTSPVSFMAKNYPGKSDEEYRRHLGA